MAGPKTQSAREILPRLANLPRGPESDAICTFLQRSIRVADPVDWLLVLLLLCMNVCIVSIRINISVMYPGQLSENGVKYLQPNI
jgi:hypothetical protein